MVGGNIKNALSIDFEDCLCNPFLVKYIPDDIDRKSIEDQAIEATDRLLKLLDKYDTKATFFVLGKLAEKYPEYIKMLSENGHEIGCHAYSHNTLYEMGRKKFDEEMKLSTKLLKSIIHEQPLGFRAPFFSVNQSTSWAFDVIDRYGYKYDSSIFPIRMFAYGVPNAPLTPYRPNINDISKNDRNGKIIEFPMTVMNVIANIPISGGFYLRALPSPLLKYFFGRVLKRRSTILYIHPWETYNKTPRLDVPLSSKIQAYYGINKATAKLEKLLARYKFDTVREVLNL